MRIAAEFATTRPGLPLADLATDLQLRLGFQTIIAAHALFNISLVLLLVKARLSGMDRTHVEASYDLYGTPRRTFWQITFPQLLPAIVAGFLLSFTFAFDDYLITTFVNGQGTSTIPLFVFGRYALAARACTLPADIEYGSALLQHKLSLFQNTIGAGKAASCIK